MQQIKWILLKVDPKDGNKLYVETNLSAKFSIKIVFSKFRFLLKKHDCQADNKLKCWSIFHNFVFPVPKIE